MKNIIAEINKLGYRINNLFQVDEDYWRCNLRREDTKVFFDFAVGPTAEDALRGALAKAENDISDLI